MSRKGREEKECDVMRRKRRRRRRGEKGEAKSDIGGFKRMGEDEMKRREEKKRSEGMN